MRTITPPSKEVERNPFSVTVGQFLVSFFQNNCTDAGPIVFFFFFFRGKEGEVKASRFQFTQEPPSLGWSFALSLSLFEWGVFRTVEPPPLLKSTPNQDVKLVGCRATNLSG